MLINLRPKSFYEAISYLHSNTKKTSGVFTVPSCRSVLYNRRSLVRPEIGKHVVNNCSLVSCDCKIPTPLGVDGLSSIVRVTQDKKTTISQETISKVIHQELCADEGATYVTRDNLVINKRGDKKTLVGFSLIDNNCITVILNPNQRLVKDIGLQSYNNMEYGRHFEEVEADKLAYNFTKRLMSEVELEPKEYYIESDIERSIKDGASKYVGKPHKTNSVQVCVVYDDSHHVDATLYYNEDNVTSCVLESSMYGDTVFKNISDYIVGSKISNTKEGIRVTLKNNSVPHYPDEMDIVSRILDEVHRTLNTRSDTVNGKPVDNLYSAPQYIYCIVQIKL